MRRGSNRIDEERVSIDALVQSLRRIEGTIIIDAREESDDPPDYWLSVGERRFAVEITSIVSDQGYDAQCHSLLDSTQEFFKSELAVVGMYVITIFRRPNLPRRGSKEWSKLVENVTNCIKALSGVASGPDVELLHDRDGSLKISKLSDQGSTVGMTRTVAMWEGDVQQELAQLLEESVMTKYRKIQKKGVLDTCPDVILVLYDAYGHADFEDTRRALSKVSGFDWLHSVFWAASFSDRPNIMYPESPGRMGGFLYSKNSGWRS